MASKHGRTKLIAHRKFTQVELIIKHLCILKINIFLFLERNPVTGEVYQIISPATTPTKPMTNDFPKMNGNAELPAGPVTNGQA